MKLYVLAHTNNTGTCAPIMFMSKENALNELKDIYNSCKGNDNFIGTIDFNELSKALDEICNNDIDNDSDRVYTIYTDSKFDMYKII